MSQEGKFEQIEQIWYVSVAYCIQEAYRFSWRSKVMCKQQSTNCENLANTISQDGEDYGDLMFSSLR